MPDHTEESALLNTSWAEMFQNTGVNLVWTPQLAKLVSAIRAVSVAYFHVIQITNCGSQVRSELKTKLCPLVEVVFKFHSSQTKSAIKKNCTLAEELKEGTNFAFKVGGFLCGVLALITDVGGQHRALVQDEHCGFLKAPIIQKIINMMWFANKNDEGIKYHIWFKPFPLPALALVLTVVSVMLHHWVVTDVTSQIECCIDKWMTGTRTDMSFMVHDYHGGYDSHLKCLQDFDEVTKEFGVLKGICAKIYEDGW